MTQSERRAPDRYEEVTAPVIPAADTDGETLLCSLVGAEARLTGATEALADLLGRSTAQLEGLRLVELVHAEDLVDVVASLVDLVEGASEVLFDCALLAADDGPVHLRCIARAEPDGQRWAMSGRDHAQVDRLRAERAELRRRVALALGPPSAAAWELDARRGLLTWEPAAATVLATGVGPLPRSAAALTSLTRPEDAGPLARAVDELLRDGSTEVVVRLAGVGERSLAVRGRVVERDRRGRPRRAVGLVLDVTHERLVEEQMVALSTSGALPGVPHRRAFDAALTGEWRRCTRSFEPLSVLVIDLDDFADLNRDFGHDVGDEVLVRVARDLGGALHRAGDVLARTGGQEFGVVLPGIDADGAAAVAERLLQVVREVRLPSPARRTTSPPSSGAHPAEMSVSVSIGCASWTSGAQVEGSDQLRAEACKALYVAKTTGKDRAVVHRREVEQMPEQR